MPPSPSPSGSPDPLAQKVNDLRDSLLALHKTLVDYERGSYEKTFGVIGSQNEFLQLLIKDPWFAWLHPISELVVEMDEMVDGKEPLTAGQVIQVFAQVRALLKASEEGHGFERSYFEALQAEPDVVMAHAGVVRCLKL
jgi:hypothetical protein